MSLEAQIQSAAEKAVLHFVTSGGWLQPDYASRVKLPPEFINEVWAMVDREKVKTHLAARIEQELADRVMNHLATERREALRAVARTHLDAICNPKSKT